MAQVTVVVESRWRTSRQRTLPSTRASRALGKADLRAAHTGCVKLRNPSLVDEQTRASP